MFSNLKKKIEAEVGDLSRLTPSLRSMTSNSEKMTPLSSRHNSVSSLASETSLKVSSPMSPPSASASGSSASDPYGGGAVGGKLDNGRPENPQKLKRVYEKLQTQELDFAWQLSSKDDEISKLQKQVEHLNSLLHSKEFETQQKLVRVQEDMDSLEGFSQQENAKIKHLLLNREEELSQQRAAVMMRDSTISEFETQVKAVTVENERLKRSLDEVVGRSGLSKSAEEAKKDKDQREELESRLKDITSEHSAVLTKLKQTTDENTHLHSEIDKIKSINVGVLQADEAKKKDRAELESRLQRVTSEHSAVLAQLKETSEENRHLHSEIDQIRKDIGVLEAKKDGDRCKELESRLQSITSEHSAVLTKLKETSAENSHLHSEIDKIRRDIEVLEAKKDGDRCKELESRLQSITSEHSAVLTKLKETSAENSHLHSEIDKIRRDIGVLEAKKDGDRCKELESRLQKITSEHSTVLAQLQETSEENSHLHSEIDQIRKDIGALEAKKDGDRCKELESRLQKITSEYSAVLAQLQETSEENSHLHSEIDKISKNIGVLEAELESGRNQFQTVQNEQERVLNLSKTNEMESERVLMEKEALIICVQSKLNESVAERNQLKETILQVQEQLHTAKKTSEDTRVKLNELTKEFDKLKVDNTSCLESSALELQSREDIIKSLEKNMEALKSNLLSLKEESTAEVNELRTRLSQTESLAMELEEKDSQLCTLETAMQSLETENSEQALEISEIQSKFDQLEEENKFMKEASQKPAVLEEKLEEMETELAEKTQMLKQQSHQLQDLRRSLAKEINKNQAESLSGQATPPVSNGGMSAQLVSSPPTLPPQETDVNFMYLRSVLFKFLTTTDVQVTQQLTKVVATLLHLSDEETNLLSQSTDSRNSWISHLISKS